jgi:hypothetical protein
MSLLLEQDRTETCIEGTDTLILQDLPESTDKTTGVCRLRNKTNTGSLKRAESDISEELRKCRRSQVDSCAVVGGSLISEDIDRLLLEQLITSELECALEEVSSSSGAETGQQSTGTLLCDNLSETSNKTFVICDGVELDSCLDTGRDEC